MSLAFLAKKSWHTANLKNVEQVWLAEQKHAQEQKKLAEVKKQIEEERQIQELRELQAAAGHKTAAKERVDWMYDGPMAHSNTTNEYLLGKEYKPSTTSNDISSQSVTPGALWSNSSNSVNDSFSRLHEDPMLLIKKRQQQAQANILKNPVKMKRIRDHVQKELEDKKMRKKMKKEMKKKERRARKQDISDNKKDGSSKLHRSEKSSPKSSYRSGKRTGRSRLDDRKRRSYSRSRSSSRGRSYSRNKSHSRNEFYSRKRSYSRSEEGRYRRRSHADKKYSPSTDRSRHPSMSTKHEKEKIRNASNNSSKTPYGLSNAENALRNTKVDRSTLGPNKELLQKVRDAKRRKEDEKKRVMGSYSSKHISREEHDRRVEEMMNDAQQREDSISKTASTKATGSNEEVEADPKFLRKLQEEVYLDTNEGMGDRLRRNKYYVQRNADSQNFLRKD